MWLLFFFYIDYPHTEIYTLSLHDALPILQRRAQRRSQQKEERGEEDYRKREREPEGISLAEVGAVLVQLDQRDPPPGAQVLLEPHDDRDHLRDHPHPDRKLRRPEAQGEQRDRDRDRPREQRGQDHRHVRRDSLSGKEHRAVRADADEGLLAERQHAPVTGERVPHRGEQDEDQKRRQLLNHVRIEDQGDAREKDRKQRSAPREEARRARPPLDLHRAVLRRSALRTPGKTARPPPNLTISTARNSRWPAITANCG